MSNKFESKITALVGFAALVWHDGRDIYAQLPSGHVSRFAKTEAGLSKLLKLLPNITQAPGFLSGGQNIADTLVSKKRIRIAKSTLRKREAAKVTVEKRQSLDALIRKYEK